MSESERSSRICRLLKDGKSRASYIRAKLGVLVPAQIRALRLKSDMPRQSDLARQAGMHQSRISMFETPGAANVTLETLARLAAAFKVGVVVKFVPFSEMLRWENEFSQDSFDVLRLEKDEAFLDPEVAPAKSLPSGIGAESRVWKAAAIITAVRTLGCREVRAVNDAALGALPQEIPMTGFATLLEIPNAGRQAKHDAIH